MAEKIKRKWGDRKDGRWVKEAPGLNTIMASILPNRTDCEVYLNETIDVTELLKFIAKKNEEHPEYKTTLFHCAVTALNRMVRERPLMNRFVMNGRIYERYKISSAFVCKRKFEDHSEESLMFLIPKENDTLEDISKKIIGDVKETRKNNKNSDGIDDIVNSIAKLPRFLIKFVAWFIRTLDKYGKNLDAIASNDPNYSTIFLSNLGSIKCPSVYHHLNNYGTNSMMITIGVLHKEEIIMEDGHKEIRDVVDIGATLDERIADGFYFMKSLKLVKYIFAHPEMLDIPLSTPSGFEYK
ncbi:MAG: 2-oxo acid dehydrogenase subunit E2 [Clostridia bacterium]|nr:2-oxo acid dehydrogenase subunit E2 [Clostridia bacterium]